MWFVRVDLVFMPVDSWSKCERGCAVAILVVFCVGLF